MATATQTTTDTRNPRTPDMVDQMTEMFKTTMESGVRFQKEALKMLFGPTAGFESFEDVRGRLERMTQDSIEMVRKNAEQGEKLFDAQCRAGTDLVRKTFDAFRNNGGEKSDVVEQCRSAWKSGLDAMRTGLDTIAKGQLTLVENWAGLVDKTLAAADKPGAK